MTASRRIILAAVTVGLLAISAWIYWPGSNGPALLDDYNNVLIIPDLREAPELAPDYVLGNRSGPLGRPVSIATFVLESMLADGGIRLSKQVNIVIHLVNGLLAAWLMLVLLRFAQLMKESHDALVDPSGLAKNRQWAVYQDCQLPQLGRCLIQSEGACAPGLVDGWKRFGGYPRRRSIHEVGAARRVCDQVGLRIEIQN